jgi:hypothetical protein
MFNYYNTLVKMDGRYQVGLSSYKNIARLRIDNIENRPAVKHDFTSFIYNMISDFCIRTKLPDYRLEIKKSTNSEMVAYLTFKKNEYHLKAIKWFDSGYYNGRLLKVVPVGFSNYDENEYFMSFVFQNSICEAFNVKYYPANVKESKFCQSKKRALEDVKSEKHLKKKKTSSEHGKIDYLVDTSIISLNVSSITNATIEISSSDETICAEQDIFDKFIMPNNAGV